MCGGGKQEGRDLAGRAFAHIFRAEFVFAIRYCHNPLLQPSRGFGWTSYGASARRWRAFAHIFRTEFVFAIRYRHNPLLQLSRGFGRLDKLQYLPVLAGLLWDHRD